MKIDFLAFILLAVVCTCVRVGGYEAKNEKKLKI